jgi:predicted Zn finger-like uncharacterized protein
MSIPQCPSCKTRVWREALGARGRPFACGNCKTLLVKSDKAAMIWANLLANGVLALPFLFSGIFELSIGVVVTCFVVALVVAVVVGLLVYLLGTRIDRAGLPSVPNKEQRISNRT